jgi:hypothetical protein
VSDDGFLAEPTLAMTVQTLPDPAPLDITGQSLGGYRLELLIGAGGMGEVYLARDATLGRDVAIKILPRAFTSHPDRLARFEREARMLGALNHPNICAIHGSKRPMASVPDFEWWRRDARRRFAAVARQSVDRTGTS